MEIPVKPLPIGIALAAFSLPAPRAQQRVVAHPTCVATAPMPVARPTTRDQMPLIRIDTTRVVPMPIARLRACYQLDTVPANGRR